MNRAFIADGWRVKLAGPVMTMTALSAVWSLSRGFDSFDVMSILRLTSGISGLGVAAYLAWGLAHRRRPVLTISNEALEYGSIYWLKTRRTAGLRDLTGVSLEGMRLKLETRSGERLTVWLAQLSRKSRDAVRSAIEEGIRAIK